MGAITTVSVFHHDRYRSCVVPAVRNLLRSGEPGPWLQAVWDHLQRRYPADLRRPFSFEPNGSDDTRLNTDLVPTQVSGEEWLYLPATGTRERANLIELYQLAVEGCCLGESVPVATHHWWDYSVDDDIFVTTAEVHDLLSRLTTRAQVWNDWHRGNIEGVRGWLDPTETATLGRELHRIELPDRPANPSELNRYLTGYYQNEYGYSVYLIRSIADRAWELGCGMLCATKESPTDRTCDLQFTAPHPAYSTDTVQQLARAIRDRREFDVLPVLADALQEAGCENDVVLTHCRDANEHTDACWVADLILSHAP